MRYGQVEDERHVVFVDKVKRQLYLSYCLPFSSLSAFWNAICKLFPILSWLPSYDFRNLLVGDIVGGITTGIIHIPQGIAYAGLNGVDPVYGLYVSFFPALFYMLFGTSRHASVGSFAVLSLMAKNAGDKVTDSYLHMNALSHPNERIMPPTHIETATMLTFCMGIWQLLCGVFRLQFIVSYFSDPLISGFTTGAGCHVLVAQIDNLIGVTTHNSSSFGFVFERILKVPGQIPEANFYTIIISIISIIFLEIGKEIISPLLVKKFNFKFPLPYDLLLIVISAAASIIFSFNENYGIRVVGEIPQGIPAPSFPNTSIFLLCLYHSIPLTVVAIAVHIAMTKMLAKKLNYPLDDSQEFYAIGFTSLLSGLFPLYPMSTGVGRTMASLNAGSHTQLSSLFSCGLLFITILKIGTYLRELPKCVLSAIIVTALLSLFKRKEELQRLYTISKIDFIIWIISFVSTVCIGVIEGLAISICAGLLSIILRTQWPRYSSSIYPTTRKCTMESSICVFHYDGPLLFTNCERFLKSFERTFADWIRKADSEKAENPMFFIFDCSAVAHIDFMGIKALEDIAAELKSNGISLYLANTNRIFQRKIHHSEIEKILPSERLFPTVKDAILFAERNGEAAVILNIAKQVSHCRLSSERDETEKPKNSPSNEVFQDNQIDYRLFDDTEKSLNEKKNFE